MKSRTKEIIFILLLLIISNFTYADENLKKAEELLKIEDYINARELFKRYIEDPKLADRALLGLAKSEYFLGNYYEATIPLKRLLRDFKNSPLINEGNLYMGLSYLKTERLKEAQSYLKKVEPPFDKQANIGLGWISLYNGEIKFVESVLQKLEKKDFNEPETALLRIKYLAITGKAEEALKEFNRNPRLRKSIYEIDRAEILIKANKLSEAENILKKLVDRSKKLSDIIKVKKMLFEVYLAQNKTNEALKVGKDILTYMPTDDLRLKLYSIYMKDKNYDEAYKILFGLRDKNLKTKKIEEFIKNLMDENTEKAIFYIVKIYPFLSSDSSLLLQSVQFLISQGRYNEAKNILRKVQTGPRKSEALIPYSKILIIEGKLGEAKKLLEPIKEKNEMAKALYAQILYREGDRANALNHLRKIAKSIKEPEILTLIGDLEYSDGDKKKAIQYWLEASNAGNVEATIKAADYFYLSNKIKEAIQYYKRAIDMGIKDNNATMWVYYQYGKLAKDKKYLEKVAESKGELAEAAKAFLEKL
ncbi:MAG: hypothetical protein RMI30_04740 [Thermodesulfovibrio sp.]|nr:hypothetical protein [Thermodesulfovibrio sp.]MDW7998743.1 hypothetical protein [Thermodesulfovibrio sp.]